jgi:hypothetical protein
MWAGLVLLAFLAASGASAPLPRFAEAPEYRNGDGCPAAVAGAGVCDPGLVHIAMTLDADTPSASTAPGVPELRTALAASFPSLRFEIYPFRPDAMTGLISASMRAALEAPLNNARNHLADLLAVDDVRRLWETRLQAAAVVGFIRGREVGGEEVEEGRREGGGCCRGAGGEEVGDLGLGVREEMEWVWG